MNINSPQEKALFVKDWLSTMTATDCALFYKTLDVVSIAQHEAHVKFYVPTDEVFESWMKAYAAEEMLDSLARTYPDSKFTLEPPAVE